MAKNRYINTHIWRDTWFAELDPSERLLFIYLLTNPETNIAGVYELPLRQIAFDTGFSVEATKVMLDRFERDGKAVYEKGWVLITNFIKHQKLNPKVEKGIQDALSGCPEWVYDRLSKPMYRLSKASNYLNLNSNSNTNSNGTERSVPEPSASKQSDNVTEVTQAFEMWQNITNQPNTRLTDAKKKKIRARLREFSIDQLRDAFVRLANEKWHKDKGKFDFDYCWRNTEQIEKFLGYKSQEQVPDYPTVDEIEAARAKYEDVSKLPQPPR